MTDAKSKILARRARFLAAAAASVGLAAAAPACTGDDVAPNPLFGDAGLGNDADATLDADTSPMPCLTAPVDSSPADSADTSVTDGAGDADTGPMPCLTPLPPDSSTDGSGD